MERPLGRFGYASGLAVLAAIQAAILSASLSFWYGLRHAPKSEFAGLAVFGRVLLAGAITAASFLVIGFMVVYVSYNPGSPFYGRAVRTLLSSISCGIAAIVLTAVFGGGAGWAMTISGLALVVGVVYLIKDSRAK